MSYDMGKGQEHRKGLLAELDRIVEILENEDIEHVILFGSLARGTTCSASDIDRIVVRDTGSVSLFESTTLCAWWNP